MAHFEVGKKVIAIRNHSQGKFKRGQVFPLDGIRKSHCKCRSIELNVGIKSTASIQTCVPCNTDMTADGHHWFHYTCFAPYDDSLSELTAEDILNEQTVTI